ncbi:hypothetical protein [Streptomyces zagrosensis]|uniref:Uncharacterized protein n=1 Tax=Streptomyces zagrosensis TaxID=1042984 RepID=A0A7W9V2A4_9ACTN|nr:hypothetical protein [Streptomyces zagrosensis]MBB5938639.1 hypothetical protein [Streptomyces zagrosensis]
MIPARVPDEPLLTYADSFDIPVLFRSGPTKSPGSSGGRPSTRRGPDRTGSRRPTAGTRRPPREIIKAATEVGRDVTPDLQNQPRYAHGELVARVSPLYAYLGAHPVTPRQPADGAKGADV